MGVFGLTSLMGSELWVLPLPWGSGTCGLVLLCPSHSSGCSQSLQGLLRLQMFWELWDVSCPANTAPQNCQCHQEAAPADFQQGGKDSSQPAHALYKTCCFCLIVFSKCSLLKPLSYCSGFHLKYMFRLVT